jgi:hypothetical protein
MLFAAVPQMRKVGFDESTCEALCERAERDQIRHGVLWGAQGRN